MPPRPTTSALHRALFADAAAIVEREFAYDLTLDALAARIATSRRQLQRAYATAGETTFRAHLARVRMDHARELLRDPYLTVRDVGLCVGYQHQAHFAKAFRRASGISPSDYREQVLGTRFPTMQPSVAGLS